MDSVYGSAEQERRQVRMKSTMARLSPELRDICAYRKNKFGTSFTQETKNLVTIMGELERRLGIDIKNAMVTKDGVQMTGKNKIWVLK